LLAVWSTSIAHQLIAATVDAVIVTVIMSDYPLQRKREGRPHSILFPLSLRHYRSDYWSRGDGVLQSPQPPPTEAILTIVLNDISAVPNHFVLVLDDYHVIDAKPIDTALTFLLEHLPPQIHLVIATREDPQLALIRLRARDQLTELRAADLHFTASEAAEFLNQVMSLHPSAEDIAALDERTEGWIAGLQLAAISLQGYKDPTGFIQSFTGSQHFVMDYLLEEVLKQQPTSVQTFLLRTSILDRLCGPLCDAVLLDPAASGQATLEYLEHAKLFIVPLNNERRLYRYQHLFADLLRQRLHQTIASSTRDAESHLNISRFDQVTEAGCGFSPAWSSGWFTRWSSAAGHGALPRPDHLGRLGVGESLCPAAAVGGVAAQPEVACRLFSCSLHCSPASHPSLIRFSRTERGRCIVLLANYYQALSFLFAAAPGLMVDWEASVLYSCHFLRD
jgi:hypothetical protein